jgi:hypothetical protein
MEQRRLRLGDILDDYCPRERRVTNHAVVAMIDEDVKQTRCTTCDAEHPYKGGKAPRRKKKEGTAALYKEVLAGMPETEATPVLTAPAEHEPEPEPEAAPIIADPPNEDVSAPILEAAEPEEDVQEVVPDVEEGPVHRPLIRATLPRPEGQKDARPLPEFTIRQAGGRGNGHFRGDSRMKARGQGGGNQGPNGNRTHGGPRFAGSRPAGPGRGAAGRGQGGGGFRSPQNPRRGGGGKKRSR